MAENSATGPDPAKRAAPDAVAWMMLLAMMIAMGGTFVFNRFALNDFAPFAVSGWRLILAAIALGILSFTLRQFWPMDRRFWGWATVYGILGFALPFHLLIWAQLWLPTNVVAVYFGSIPLQVLGLSAVVLGVRVSRRKLTGIGIGMLGLFYLAGPGTLAVMGEGSLGPQAALIAATFSLALAAVLARLMPAFAPFAIISAAAAVSAVISLPMVYVGHPVDIPGPAALSGLAAVGLVSTAFAQALRFLLIRRKGPVFLIPNSYGSVIIAGLLGWLLLDETIAWQTLAAFALITVAVLATEDGSGHMSKA